MSVACDPPDSYGYYTALYAACATVGGVVVTDFRFSAAPPSAGGSHYDAVLHLWSFREHPELALSALLRAVMGCFRSRDVGSTSRRFLDAI